MNDPRGCSAPEQASALGLLSSELRLRCLRHRRLVQYARSAARMPHLSPRRVRALAGGLSAEILVVDNASRDGSADMVAAEFSGSGVPVRLIRSDVNLGFGVANNRAIEAARGPLSGPAQLRRLLPSRRAGRALAHMEADPTAGIGGARLVGRDGAWQPSAHSFHSILGRCLRPYRPACALSPFAHFCRRPAHMGRSA